MPEMRPGIDPPLMCMVLLRDRAEMNRAQVVESIREFPGTTVPEVGEEKGGGNLCEIHLAGRRYSVISVPMAVPRDTFRRSLEQPGSKAALPLVDGHAGHLAVACQDPDGEMGDMVVVASIVHLLAKHIAEGLPDAAPIGAFWVPSERLCDWQTFTGYTDGIAPVLEDEGPIEFPGRYWVSVQLSANGDRVGGTTVGLRSIAGYEIRLTPIDWDMADVAARLVATVDYLFTHGAVLEDGQTLGATESEKFRISRPDADINLTLTLEAGAA